MIETKITCDKCGLSIEPRDAAFTGVGELVTLNYNGIMGHNQVPPDGWHFHYGCFNAIVAAIQEVLK